MRVHSNCLTGDVFGSQRCDCGPQLADAMRRVADAGGIIVYMAGHEGRGIGLWAKAATYVLQDGGENTYQANRSLGLPDDSRDFSDAAAILLHFLGGDRPFRLLTNNPKKVDDIRAHGLGHVTVEKHVTGVGEHNRRYLAAKRDWGHAIENGDLGSGGARGFGCGRRRRRGFRCGCGGGPGISREEATRRGRFRHELTASGGHHHPDRPRRRRGEATLGRKVGWRAPLWGGLCGLLPDLDVLWPFADPVSAFTWHRGYTHALAALVLATPVVAWAAAASIPRPVRSGGAGCLLAFLALLTHPLLDCFTVYGTQVFLPFSDFPVAWSTIFIIDPAFSVPVMLGVLAALVLSRERGLGHGLNTRASRSASPGSPSRWSSRRTSTAWRAIPCRPGRRESSPRRRRSTRFSGARSR